MSKPRVYPVYQIGQRVLVGVPVPTSPLNGPGVVVRVDYGPTALPYYVALDSGSSFWLSADHVRVPLPLTQYPDV